MKIKKVLELLKIGVDGAKNKRRFLKPLKKWILEKSNLDSVIDIGFQKINRLVLKGKLKLITESNGAKYYQIIWYGVCTDMVIVVREEKAKIIPLVSVPVLSRYTIYECDGNFVITYNKKTICIEKMIMHIVTGESIDELRKKDIHHKWFRFMAMPGMIVPLAKWNHRMGHARTSNYGRNQVVSFNEYHFNEFIRMIFKYRNIISEKEFGIEF